LVAFGPKYTYSKACTDAGNYIYNEFIEMGLETRKHEWNDEDPTVFNVEATLLGSNEESGEIYIICAHYDTVSESPGADDDGSGVAAVMAAAKLMSSYSTEHTVRFVTFSGEEQGLFGSRYYVEEVISENIAGVLNVDMIGFAEDEEDASYVIILWNG
jgi:acetylornithine deacetylase/succinyl-diaminopimelate desuccinylase-like protein